MPRITVRLEGERLVTRFPFDVQMIELVKRAGATYRGPDKGGPSWHLPLSLLSLRRFQSECGPYLYLHRDVRRWERHERRREERAGNRARAQDAQLRVPPRMRRYARPYQRADVAFMARTSCVNANEVGMGKTFEVIAATYEADLLAGPCLVVAGVTHLLNTWHPALSRHVRRSLVMTEVTPRGRSLMVREALDAAAAEVPFWLLVNHDMLRTHQHLLAQVNWNVFVIDEYRKVGLANHASQLGAGARLIPAERRWALSGTPMGGRIWNLWGALNWADPPAFPARWRWLEQWGEQKRSHWARSGKVFTGRLAHGREEEFYSAHAPWLLRRLKREHMPDLPPVGRPEPLWCPLRPNQRRMYEEMVVGGEVLVGSSYIDAGGVLAELTRLKQIATAPLTEDGGMSADSGKLDVLLEQLERVGICREMEGDAKAVIVTQFPIMVPAWQKALAGKGIRSLALVGATKPLERVAVNRSFQQQGGARVLFISYGAGGTGIDLDRADFLHVIDRTWDPDDFEQAVGRLDRGRPHPITIFEYLAPDTVDEHVHAVGRGKALTNRQALEVYRLVRRRLDSRA